MYDLQEKTNSVQLLKNEYNNIKNTTNKFKWNLIIRIGNFNEKHNKSKNHIKMIFY